MTPRWFRYLWPCLIARETVTILTTAYNEAQLIRAYLDDLGPDGDD
jgi:hypothetical protein